MSLYSRVFLVESDAGERELERSAFGGDVDSAARWGRSALRAGYDPHHVGRVIGGHSTEALDTLANNVDEDTAHALRGGHLVHRYVQAVNRYYDHMNHGFDQWRQRISGGMPTDAATTLPQEHWDQHNNLYHAKNNLSNDLLRHYVNRHDEQGGRVASDRVAQHDHDSETSRLRALSDLHGGEYFDREGDWHRINPRGNSRDFTGLVRALRNTYDRRADIVVANTHLYPWNDMLIPTVHVRVNESGGHR